MSRVSTWYNYLPNHTLSTQMRININAISRLRYLQNGPTMHSSLSRLRRRKFFWMPGELEEFTKLCLSNDLICGDILWCHIIVRFNRNTSRYLNITTSSSNRGNPNIPIYSIRATITRHERTGIFISIYWVCCWMCSQLPALLVRLP